MRLHLAEFEDVFLAGLLHDIGIILEDQHVHTVFAGVVSGLREGSRLREAEQKCLSFDHTMLGGRLANAWRMPNGIADSVRHHHDSASYDGNYTPTVRCVELANFICSLKGMASVGVHLVEFPRAGILALSLGKEDLVVLANDLDREIDSNQSLFQI
jgi:HD-like signal output (HDOD) protein